MYRRQDFPRSIHPSSPHGRLFIIFLSIRSDRIYQIRYTNCDAEGVFCNSDTKKKSKKKVERKGKRDMDGVLEGRSITIREIKQFFFSGRKITPRDGTM